mmetsp:Transcript_64192/g.191624  ORF Transcript_64192/g.191624 Transcript_64192/m.191624 type:complete len:332 (-) Transcript_64192:651-1646(-)
MTTVQAAAAEQGLTGGDAVDVMEEGRSDAALERMREVQGVGVDRFMGFYLRRAPSEVRRRYLQAMRETADDLQSASELPRETKKQRTARREAVRAAAPAAWTQYVGVLLPKPGEDAALFGRKRDVWLQPHGLKLFMLTLKPVSMTWRWSGTYRCARRASGRAATRRRRRWCWRWRGSRRMWSGAASTADSSISAVFRVHLQDDAGGGGAVGGRAAGGVGGCDRAAGRGDQAHRYKRRPDDGRWQQRRRGAGRQRRAGAVAAGARRDAGGGRGARGGLRLQRAGGGGPADGTGGLLCRRRRVRHQRAAHAAARVRCGVDDGATRGAGDQDQG